MASTSNFADHSPRRRTLYGSASQLAVQLTILPIGVVVLAYLTRRLGPSTYGDYATVMTVLVWVEFALTSLLTRAIIKFVAHAQDALGTAAAMVRASAVLGACSTALVWMLSPWIALALGDQALRPLFALGSLDVALFVIGSAYVAAIAGLGRFGRRAAATSLRWPFRLGLAILLIESGFGVRGALWAVIGASLGEIVICVIACPLPWRRMAPTPRRPFLAEAAPLLGVAMTLRLLDGGDLLMLRWFGATPGEVGSYALAMNLAMLPGLGAAAVCPVLMASIVRLRAAGRERELRQLALSVVQLAAWLIPPTVALCLASHTIVPYCFGSSFEPAARLFQVLLWAGLARMAISVAGVMLAGAGPSSWAWRVSYPLLPLALVGYISLIPRYGALGAAWATALTSLLGVGLSALSLRRRLDARLPSRTGVAVGLSSAIIAGLAGIGAPGGLQALAYVAGEASSRWPPRGSACRAAPPRTCQRRRLHQMSTCSLPSHWTAHRRQVDAVNRRATPRRSRQYSPLAKGPSNPCSAIAADDVRCAMGKASALGKRRTAQS